jgi:hypothetical protein
MHKNNNQSAIEFEICIMMLATNLCTLEDNISNTKAVKNVAGGPRSAIPSYGLPRDVLRSKQGVDRRGHWARPCMFEEHDKPKEVMDAMGHLMLCEEDWEAHRKARREWKSSGSGSRSGGRDKNYGCGRGHGGTGPLSCDGRDG